MLITMKYILTNLLGLLPLIFIQLTISNGQKFLPLTNRFKEDPYSGTSHITPYGYRATFRDSGGSGFRGQGQRSGGQRSGEVQNSIVSYQTYDPRVLSSKAYRQGKYSNSLSFKGSCIECRSHCGR